MKSMDVADCAKERGSYAASTWLLVLCGCGFERLRSEACVSGANRVIIPPRQNRLMRIGLPFTRTGALSRNEVIIIIVVLVVGLLLLAITVPCMIPARSTAQLNTIGNNLRIIEGAKEQWALKNAKTTEDAVSLTDLTEYFKNNQIPPSLAGETYQVTKVGALAKAILSQRLNGRDGALTTTSF